MTRSTLPLLLFALALAACNRGTEQATPAGPATAPAAGTEPAPATPAQPVELKDVVESNERYVIGISYPPAARKYPGLAAQLQQYAEAARAELLEAVGGLGNDKPTAPYDLSLSFTELVDTPQIVAIAADGSSYTGGAHGSPLIARFVWLPQQDKLLTSKELVPQAAGWKPISDYVREQLHTKLSERADADELPPAERAEMIRDAGKMIDEGSEAEADNFSQFEPVIGADGKLSALRFVFPPYQVGPYADGTQTVEVPAAILLPHIAPAYRGYFSGG
ncbi:DUF3298 and DUF4163 domain-containing protein [Luteimonas sp. SX5]|uniref:DUF3298 and DUF4163 domain-containing protein n=1 Tax=Luteimonas galliterrae TaxID=2940486 RepID=A0ABT0MF02_9GAMM|nr:DUF3298 and DUF4163 domain-containing protein [Luteimonas galliterrae]MCL1633452.1 DUF3298 and DUF4163 domain-containing protein [Luteimonas galliterrae]